MIQHKILAISGSLRSGSTNHNILKYLGELLPRDISYSIYDELALIPPFDPGLDNEDVAQPVVRLRKLLNEVDGVIICTPEYAFGVPGQLKNMLDWMVSSGSLVDKPVALITASLGGEHAHASLLLTLGALSAKIIDDATLVISFIRSKMDNNGNLINEEAVKNLNKVLQALLSSF
jgi:chromate reductase